MKCAKSRYNNVVLKEHQKAVDNDITTTTTTNNNNNNDNDINDYNLTFVPDLKLVIFCTLTRTVVL